MDCNKLMTRREFLKKTAVGALSLALFGKFGLSTVQAATVTDNLSSNGIHKGATAPADINKAWIDTGNGGILKYWNGSAWTPTRATWSA